MNSNNSKKLKILKIIAFILTIIVMIACTVYLFPVIKKLSTHEGQELFKQKVNKSGIYGFLTLLGLQFAQIFLAFLPGEPLEILAGMCYGAFWGTIFLFFSIALSTTVIYLLVYKFGREFIYQNFSKERIDKIENSKIFQNPKKIEYVLAICFAITGTPKDILVYVGGLLPINPVHFILIATFCRFPSIVSSTIVGQYFSEGNWKISVFIYGITFAITLLFIFIIGIFDKEKITKKALKELKFY